MTAFENLSAIAEDLGTVRAGSIAFSPLANEKRLHQQVLTVLDDPQLADVLREFGASVFRRSSVLEGFAEFLSDCSVSGKRCVEIGTCKGLTALVLARHFEEVVTIDVVADPERQEIAKFAGAGNILFVTSADNSAKARMIESLDFDFAYVDGDHARDTESDFALVERCKRVLFHEYWPAQPAVFNLVNRLAQRGKVGVSRKLALWDGR